MVREARRRRGGGSAARRGDDRQGHGDHPVAQARQGDPPPLEGRGRGQGAPRARRAGARGRRRGSRSRRRAARRRPRPCPPAAAEVRRDRARGSRRREGARHAGGPGARPRSWGSTSSGSRPPVRPEGSRRTTCGDARLANGRAARPPPAAPGTVEVVPVRGLRRRIAEKMALSKRTAAHFTFVEQVDATEPRGDEGADGEGRRRRGGEDHLPPVRAQGGRGRAPEVPAAQRLLRRGARGDPPEALVRPGHRRGHRPGAHRPGGPARRPALHRRPGAGDRPSGRRQPGRQGCARRTWGTPPSR